MKGWGKRGTIGKVNSSPGSRVSCGRGLPKSFDKDVDGIKDKKLLRKLRTLISTIESAESIQDIPHVKKIEGYKSYYRIKIGDHRLGMEVASNKEVILLRFLHRKDIYRYFPKRG